MKVTDYTRRLLAIRRQRRDLLKAGYRMLTKDAESHGVSLLEAIAADSRIMSLDGRALFYK